MPLRPGSSNNVISHNISELAGSGYSNPKQRVAIALSNARRHPLGHISFNHPEEDTDQNPKSILDHYPMMKSLLARSV